MVGVAAQAQTTWLPPGGAGDGSGQLSGQPAGPVGPAFIPFAEPGGGTGQLSGPKGTVPFSSDENWDSPQSGVPAGANLLPLTDPVAAAAENDPDLPRDARPGVFQKVLLADTWLARIGNRGFGMDDVELSTVWGLPCPTRAWPLVITPGFSFHALDGPSGLDLPSRLYDIYSEFRWAPRFGERLRVDVSVTPGYYSDFQNNSRQAVRVTGYGMGIWNWTPTLKLVLGAAYLDRPDTNVLPIAGVSWNPDEATELCLVFPKPKIAHRLYWDGVHGTDVEYWVYLAGELGGGTWAIREPNGADGLLGYSDWRCWLGIERKAIGGLSGRVEIGYVFQRKIQPDTGLPDFYPNDTLALRGGLRY
ncbi:MAG: hypothetical protein ABSF26_17105 [Thermoguttaceae bacterium]|jgi:hypothetical protein